MGTVNMAGERPSYHHGDLRPKLIETAMDCIERDGVAKLSLRKIAADLGVSHNAPYMHFASKDTLLDAVIARGFAMLRAAIAEAGGSGTLDAGDWDERVKRGLHAYVRFARERSGLYALMHVPRGATRSGDAPERPDSDADGAGAATLQRLAATLEAGQRLGKVRAGDPTEMAIWVWVTLHGLASLTSDERQAFAGRAPDAVTETVLDSLIEALAG
mgnify:CR=1 FL=1